MLNSVVLIGRLTKDIEVRRTQSGKSVAQFTLAVQERRDVEADFIDCVVWEKMAETMATYTHKGSMIGVKGGLKKRSYEDSTGRKVYVTEVLVERVAFLDSRNSSQDDSKASSGRKAVEEYDSFTADDLPF